MLEADLILLDFQGLDVIYFTDRLAVNYDSMDCFHKEFIFRLLG